MGGLINTWQLGTDLIKEKGIGQGDSNDELSVTKDARRDEHDVGEWEEELEHRVRRGKLMLSKIIPALNSGLKRQYGSRWRSRSTNQQTKIPSHSSIQNSHRGSNSLACPFRCYMLWFHPPLSSSSSSEYVPCFYPNRLPTLQNLPITPLSVLISTCYFLYLEWLSALISAWCNSTHCNVKVITLFINNHSLKLMIERRIY